MKQIGLSKEYIKEAVTRAINEMLDRANQETPEEKLAYTANRVETLASYLKHESGKLAAIIKDCTNEVAQFINTGKANYEYNENEVEIMYELNTEGVIQSVKSNSGLLNKLTGNFGDYEGMSPEEIFSDWKSIISIFDEYILDEIGGDKGRGYSVSYSVMSNPYSFNVKVALVITIETPVNWEALSSIDNIMDF